jgi:hypothetical protein
VFNESKMQTSNGTHPRLAVRRSSYEALYEISQAEDKPMTALFSEAVALLKAKYESQKPPTAA